MIAYGRYENHAKHLLSDPLTLPGAKRECRTGKVTSVDNKGIPYNHITKVRENQKGLIDELGKITRKLEAKNLDPSQREKLINEKIKVRALLQHSNKFVPIEKKGKGDHHLPKQIEVAKASQSIRSRKKSSVLGYVGPKNPANKDFEQKVQQARLTDSYNSTHRHNPIQAKGGTGGEIGGVACSTAYIEGLFDSPEDLFEREHFFYFPGLPDGKMPFTDSELKQILRELAIGVYVHSTIPFFSLHFNQNSDQFPVIHPAYEGTLTGRITALL